MKPGPRYLVVSPCRDEAKHMRRTLESVAAQSVPPAAWVVVDDGSTDETPRILEEYALRLPFLRVVRIADRGRRAVGPGVVEAFYRGLAAVELEDFDYVCKLDMDLDLPLRYFEHLLRRMEEEPRLGCTSGKAWFQHPRTGALVREAIGDEVSVGASKFYRVACFREIGGFVREVMWDGIDCHRARMLGWMVESVDRDELRFLHLRPMGSSERGIWAGRVRDGFGQWFMGTSPLFMLVRAVYRLPRHPVLTGSVAMLWGYLSSAARRAPRYEDPAFRRFLRRYQRLSLLVGRAAAARKVTEERAPAWRATHRPHAPVEDEAARTGATATEERSAEGST
jgi:glycosyltransferase involved in cell wall biosynthesis